MWQFLQTVLERHGLASVISVVVLAGFGYGIRALWLQNQSLHQEIQKTRDEEHRRRMAMREAFVEELTELKGQLRAETRLFAERLDALQEKRVVEASTVVRELVQHVTETRNSVERITEVVSTLRDVIRGG